MKKMYFFINLLFCSICYTQSPHPLDFFPHLPGDLWQMRSCYDGSIVSTEEVERDSIDSLGNIFIKFKQYNGFTWKIDTSYNIYDSYLRHYYKLNAAIGDTWTYISNIRVRVADIYPDTLWGIPTIIKKYEYWGFYDFDSLWFETRYLASNFGLIKYDFEPGDCYYLAGCKIDSVQYGWIQDVKYREHILRDFLLSQNYPNPFNPTTVIRYQLPVDSYVALKIFDVLGRGVATLVDEYKSAGYYDVSWDAVNLPSGVYYYKLVVSSIGQLTANNYTSVKKMLLMK